jgi:hypothetical protein
MSKKRRTVPPALCLQPGFVYVPARCDNPEDFRKRMRDRMAAAQRERDADPQVVNIRREKKA